MADTFEIGDVVTHITTGIKMQVVKYGRPDNNLSPDAIDKTKLVCKYLQSKTGEFTSGTFFDFELKKS